MPHKQDTQNPFLHCHIYGFPNKITAFHILFKWQRKMLLQKSFPVISRCYQKHLVSLGNTHIHFHFNTFDQCLLTHRLHNSCGTQYRNSALNTQAGIKRLLCRLPALWNRNQHQKTSLITELPARFLHGTCNHTAGDPVNGSGPRRLIKSRHSHTSHPVSAFYLYPRLAAKRYLCTD